MRHELSHTVGSCSILHKPPYRVVSQPLHVDLAASASTVNVLHGWFGILFMQTEKITVHSKDRLGQEKNGSQFCLKIYIGLGEKRECIDSYK